MSGLNRKFRKNNKPDQVMIEKNDGNVMAYRIKDKNIMNIIRKFYLDIPNHHILKDDLKDILNTEYITSDNSSFLTLFLEEDINNPDHFTDLGDVNDGLYNQLTKIGTSEIPNNSRINEFDINSFEIDKESGHRLIMERSVPREVITLYNYLSKYFNVHRTPYGHICLDIKNMHYIMYDKNLGEVA